MKFLQSLVILIAISSLTMRKLKTSKNQLLTRSFKNNAYQLILGFLSETSSAPFLFTSCLKMHQNQIPETDNQAESTSNESQPTWKKILALLGKAAQIALGIVCKFKSKIISMLTRRFRRYIRLFLQGKTVLGFKTWNNGIWDSIKSVGNKIATGAKAVGNAIADGAKAVGKAVVKGAQSIYNGVKTIGEKVIEGLQTVWKEIKEVFKPIFNFFIDLKNKFLGFLNSPIVKKLISFAHCIMANKADQAIQNVIQLAKALITLIPQLATPAGWVQVAVNLICGWKNLIAAIKLFMKAKNSTSSAEKYSSFGMAIGKIVKTFAGVTDKKKKDAA